MLIKDTDTHMQVHAKNHWLSIIAKSNFKKSSIWTCNVYSCTAVSILSVIHKVVSQSANSNSAHHTYTFIYTYTYM